MTDSNSPVTRRAFLGMTSVMTLQSLAPGQSVLSRPERREFRIRVCLDGTGENSSRLAEVFGELTKGLILETHDLSAEYRIAGRGSIALEVSDATMRQTLKTSVIWNFSKGLEDVHGLYAEAVRLAVQLAPDEPYLIRALGDYVLAFHRHAVGIAWFKQLVERNPERPQLLFQLGVLYERAGRKREAYAAFRDVHRLDPHDTVALYNLGVISADLGHLNQAERWFLESLAVNASMTPARTRLDLLRQRREGPRFRFQV